jgi:GAF domain
MKSRALRFALATLFVGVLGGAAYVMWSEESEGNATADAARQFDDRTRLVARALLDIKGAQPGYVAAGQGEDFWTTKIDALLASAREGFAALRTEAQSAQAQTEIETAAAAFEDFEQMDRRAREYARNGQRLLASDLVFSDGIEKMDAGVAALERARSTELAARDADLQQRRRKQWFAAGGAAALSLLTLALLIPLPREAPPYLSASAITSEPAADHPVSRPGPVAVPSLPAPALSAAVAPAPTTAVDLAGIASLCSELTRIVDTRALPGALERAATLLQASGLIIWVADPDGRELAPIVAHGYPQNLVARLGTINREAENVTAAAFRTGLVQTAKAEGTFPGAIAAPLLTSTGPVGVMAAEVLNGGERQESTRSVATIVAAQLATLVGPPTRPQPKSEAAGA